MPPSKFDMEADSEASDAKVKAGFVDEFLEAASTKIQLSDEARVLLVKLARDLGVNGKQLANRWESYAINQGILDASDVDESNFKGFASFEKSAAEKKQRKSVTNKRERQPSDLVRVRPTPGPTLTSSSLAELGSFYDNAEEKENKDNAVKRQTVKSEKKELEEAIAMDISPDDEEDDSSSKTGVVQAPSTPPHVVSSAISSSSPSFTNETPSPPKRFKGEHETPRPAAGSAPVSMYNLAGKEGILEMETLVVSVSFTVGEARRYMNESLADRNNAIVSRRAELLDLAAECVSETVPPSEGLHPVGVPSNVEVAMGGMLVCEPPKEQSSNRSSWRWMLLGTHGDTNAISALILSSFRDSYSLFPGMVCAMSGISPDGVSFRPSRLHLPPLPRPPPAIQLPMPTASDSSLKRLTVMIGSGPFSPHSDLAYKPLRALLEEAERIRPSVLVLMGPFVDMNHPLVNGGCIPVPLDTLFVTQLSRIAKACEKPGLANTQVVILPAAADAAHPYRALPQQPFLASMVSPNLHLAPNPCHLNVVSPDGMTEMHLSICSEDALSHLSANEISGPGNQPDRVGRLLRHLQMQRSVYPLYPPSTIVNPSGLSSLSFPSSAQLPHAIITPASRTNPFVRMENGCLCVNPGRTGRFAAGGTYSVIHAVSSSSSPNGDVELCGIVSRLSRPSS